MLDPFKLSFICVLSISHISASESCPKDFDCGPYGTCLKDPLMPKHQPVCRCEKGSFKNKDGKCVGT